MNHPDIRSIKDDLAVALRNRVRRPFPVFLRAWFLTITPLTCLLGVLAFFPEQAALWVLVGLVAGFSQNALGILMHEGSHYFFHHKHPVNDVWANLLVSLPIFNTVEGYRSTHFEHHRNSGEPADPYFELYADYPSRKHLIRGLLKDCTGISAAHRFYQRYSPGKALAIPHPRYVVPGYLLIHAGLAGLFYFVTGRWYAYALLWLIPLMTIPIAINRFRTVVEHYPGFLGIKINRTSLTSQIEYLCVAPYGYGHHLEHHLLPQIPYYQLEFTHNFLKQHGMTFTDNEVNTRGYFRTFLRLLREMGRSRSAR